VINSKRPAAGRTGAWLTALGSVAVPILLMRTLWPEPWVSTYALVFTCAALALTAGLVASRSATYGLGSWALGLAAALGLTGLILLSVAVRGTSWAELGRGVVLAPLRHPSVYAVAVEWGKWVRLAAVIQLLTALWYHFRSP